MSRMIIFALALLVASISAPAQLRAQGASAEEDPREAFRLGSEAAQEERWADSERWFRRAYELSQVPSALFNQAVALRALGRHREARDAFRSLLDADIDARVREAATGLLRESVQRVVTLRLAGLEENVEHGVQIDGEDRGDDLARPLDIETDEGRHSLLVVRAGYEPFQWSGNLEPGTTQTVEVALEEIPEHTVVVTETVREGRTVLDEPLFWILVGAVVVAGVGVGIGIGFVEAQLQPEALVRFDI